MNVARSVLGLLVVGSAACVVGVVVACNSNGGESAAPCSTATASACEAGSVLSNGQCVNVAGSLAGLRWELPCTSQGSPCQTVVDGGDVQFVSTSLGGMPGQTYAVTLHFRGVVEMKTYAEGEAGAPQTAGAKGLANAQFFVSGGADNGDNFNVYEMKVSDPPGVYFLNSGISNIQNTWWLDYTTTIAMTAGATVTLTANAVDDGEIGNVNGVDGGPVMVPGVPPYPKAYDGQFIQMDVVSVVAQP